MVSKVKPPDPPLIPSFKWWCLMIVEAVLLSLLLRYYRG